MHNGLRYRCSVRYLSEYSGEREDYGVDGQYFIFETCCIRIALRCVPCFLPLPLYKEPFFIRCNILFLVE